MNARKLPDSSVSSSLRLSTSSQTTASLGRPEAWRSARAAASEICVSIDEIAIDPVAGMSSSRRSWTSTLASSRATSARITSPGGLAAAPGRWTTFETDSDAQSRSSACREASGGATILRWTIAPA